MKKVGYVVAALGAIAIAAPTMASAETVVIKRGGHHHGYHHGWDRSRAEYRIHRDNGWHRGWHRDHYRDHGRVVIKERRW
jgi:hypothetical protein